jgi:hypothetical protein
MRNAFSGWWQRTDANRLSKDDNFGTFMPLSSMPFDMPQARLQASRRLLILCSTKTHSSDWMTLQIVTQRT